MKHKFQWFGKEYEVDLSDEEIGVTGSVGVSIFRTTQVPHDGVDEDEEVVEHMKLHVDQFGGGRYEASACIFGEVLAASEPCETVQDAVSSLQRWILGRIGAPEGYFNQGPIRRAS